VKKYGKRCGIVWLYHNVTTWGMDTDEQVDVIYTTIKVVRLSVTMRVAGWSVILTGWPAGW